MTRRIRFILIVFLVSILPGCGLDLDWKADEEFNNSIQPPQEVMDAVGVKEGMVIGEFGAAYGRFTLPLAARVGETGCIYANDIEESSLEFLRKRCRKAGLKNVRTILGEYEDPLFPKGSLDMAFSALVYHEIESPVVFLKNLIPALKPNAPIVIVDNAPGKNTEKSNIGRHWEKEFADAGLEIVKRKKLHERDVLFILKVATR
ncbi:MAG: methyltransferase domain-containing protein [Candidatus Aminicenantes bacterium]|nr:methyltransferase domain-containing protein [Candidatus Aminicenantes bacterium]